MAGTDEPPKGEGPPKPGLGPLKLADWQVFIEPRAMWAQIYDETWRIQRDFFYDPGYHGLDLAKAKKKYAPYLAGIASRDELTYLFNDALGELTVGHMFVGGGERPEVKQVKGGLLGADYTHRERPLPHRARVQRRQLESGAAGAADSAGRQREGGGLHSRRQFTRAALVRQHLRLLRRHRRQAGGVEGGAATGWHRLAPSHRGAGRQRRESAPPAPGSRTTAARWTRRRRARGVRVRAEHGRRGLHELQPVLLLAGRQGGRDHRRALQRRRPARRLHHRLPAPAR